MSPRRSSRAPHAASRVGRRRRWRRLIASGGELWERSLELAPVWIVIFVLGGTWCLMPSGTFLAPRAEVGAIATRDHVATRDLLLLDRESTEAKRHKAREEILPVYDLDDGRAPPRDRRLADLFAAGRELLDSGAAGGPEQIAAALEETSGLVVEPALVSALSRVHFATEIEERLRAIVQDALGRGVVGDKTGLLENRARGVTLRRVSSGAEQLQLDLYDYLAYPDEVRELARKELRSVPGVGSADRELLAGLVVEAADPNLLPNRAETLARQDRAADAISPAYTQIRKGLMIVRKGDEVSPNAAQVIAALAGRRNLRDLLLPVGGNAVLLLLGSLALAIGLRTEKALGKSPRRLFSENLLMLLLAVLGARFGMFLASASSAAFEAEPFNAFHSYVYAVPLAALALMAQLLWGRVSALLLTVIFAALVGRLSGAEGMSATIYAVAGSLAASYAVERGQFKQRSVMTRAGIKIACVNALVILGLTAVAPEAAAGLGHVGFDLFCGAVGGVLCAAVASFGVPVLESLFSITTDIKLIEVANTNLPLLRRVAMEAPGTFQHSLMVANLAKIGCEEIGADSILAYTAGLYHDVGKIHRPLYFIENQRSGHNPHDHLPPGASVKVLVAHIEDGLELAHEHGLPRPLRDAIAQHHGTRKMTYFLQRAVEQAGGREEDVPAAAFRYPGPKPQDRVMGVLMLADAVEAASRTLAEPTTERIRSMIQRIVDACLTDGQLDETDLTLQDLQRVSAAFLHLLSNIYHRRVDYPGFDFNAEAPGSPLPSADAAAAALKVH